MFIRLLAAPFSFDIDLFNGKLIRQPNKNQLIDYICERLQQDTQIDLIKTGKNEIIFILQETLFCLFNLVTRTHTEIFDWSYQPIKSGILQLFPYVCIDAQIR